MVYREFEVWEIVNFDGYFMTERVKICGGWYWWSYEYRRLMCVKKMFSLYRIDIITEQVQLQVTQYVVLVHKILTNYLPVFMNAFDELYQIRMVINLLK